MMTRKCPKSGCFVVCNGDCLHCDRTYFGGKSVSLICREDLLQDIHETVLFSGRTDHVSAELRGANKVMDRIRVAPAVSDTHGGCEYCESGSFDTVGLRDKRVYLCGGNSIPPEHEKFRFCPNCGKKL